MSGKKPDPVADLPPGVAALLDVATARAAIRDARARRASRLDAERDRIEAARLGVSTADLPPLHRDEQA